MRALPLLLCLAVAAPTALSAQFAGDLSSFPESPAGFLMTRKETKEFRKLGSQEEAQQWIDLFWARRDPDLSTAINEFKEDFEARVRAADDQFGYEGKRGALTDRGRTLIVLGPPAGRSFEAARARLGSGGEAPASGGAQAGSADIWYYEVKDLPVALPTSQLMLTFRESRPSRGDFVLDRTNPENRLAVKTLTEAPEALIGHPELEEVPRAGLLPGSQPASEAELAVLAEDTWPEGAWATAVPGLQSEAIRPLWIHVRLPESAPSVDRVVGRLRESGGAEAVGSFSAPVEPMTVPKARAYELAIPAKAGNWEIDLALLAGGRPVATRSFAVESPSAEGSGPWISRAYWGGEVREARDAALGDPFNIGGWHVIPRPDDEYYLPSSVEVFTGVMRPAAPAAGATPAFELTMELRKDGKTVLKTPPEAAPLSQVRGDLWMFGRSVPLSGFPGPGSYELDVTLTDPASGAARTTTIPLEIAPLGS